MAKTTTAKRAKSSQPAKVEPQPVYLIDTPTECRDSMEDLCEYLNRHCHDYKFAIEERGLGIRISVAGVTSGLVFEKLAGVCVGYIDGYQKGRKRR